MRRWGRLVLGALASLLVLGVLTLAVVPLVVDLDSMRPELTARLSALLGRRVSMGRISLSLWTGLGARVDGLEVGDLLDAPEPGAVPTLQVGAARIRLAFLPLLRGTILVRSLRFEGGRVRLGDWTLLREADIEARLERSGDGVLRSTGRLQATVEAIRGGPRGDLSFAASLVEDRVVLERCSAKLGPASLDASGEATGIRGRSPRITLKARGNVRNTSAEGTVVTSLRGGRPELSFDLSSPTVDFGELISLVEGGTESAAAKAQATGGWSIVPTALAAPAEPSPGGGWLSEARCDGTLRADRARFWGLETGRLKARLHLEKGTLRFQEASFDLYGGTHRGSLSVDVVEDGLPFRLQSRLTGVNVEPLLGAFGQQGLQGTADLSLELLGRAPRGRLDPAAARGAARAELRDGRLASLGVLRQVARLLEMAGGKGIGRDDTPFRSASASFQIEAGSARTQDLEVRSDDLDLTGGGTMGLDGRLDLDLLASFSPGVAESMVNQTPKLKLRVGPDGRLSFPLRIEGTVASPHVGIDVDRVLSEGLGRILQERGRKGLRKLFGGR